MTAIETLARQLIVSVQVHERDDPMGAPTVLAAVARSVVAAGAGGIRCGGISGTDAIVAISGQVDVPVIGLLKVGSRGVIITPRPEDAKAVADAGADIVAFDATDRPRPNGGSLAAIIDEIHDAGALAMADISTVDEARAAFSLGADAVATTLSGYVDELGSEDDDPDVELVAEIARLGIGPVVAEGRFSEPGQVTAAFEAGAHAVVVGRAITSPTWLASRFVDEIRTRV